MFSMLLPISLIRFAHRRIGSEHDDVLGIFELRRVREIVAPGHDRAISAPWVDHNNFVVRGDVFVIKKYRHLRRGEIADDARFDSLCLLGVRDNDD